MVADVTVKAIATSLIALGLAVWLRYRSSTKDETGEEGKEEASNEIAAVPDHNASEGELLRWLVEMEKNRQRSSHSGGAPDSPVGPPSVYPVGDTAPREHDVQGLSPRSAVRTELGPGLANHADTAPGRTVDIALDYA